jgi:hypothetical protein
MADHPQGYVYVLSPIDLWTGWSDRETVVPNDVDASVREQLRKQVDATLDGALEQFRRRTRWEGDVREGPYFAALPPTDSRPESDLMVAVKQDNNGDVFVWSPHPLPHLNEFGPA